MRIAGPVIEIPYPLGSGTTTVDDQQQKNHDRNLKVARNEAKRAFFSDVRISTWATSIAIILVLAVLMFYFMR